MNPRMDFTLESYKVLLSALSNQGFSFCTVEGFISGHQGRVIALRHDVDNSPENSLQFATTEAERGIMGTYYFRIVPQSYNEKIIKEIYSLGHEIGYHYEDMSLVAKRQKTKVKRQKFSSQESYEKYLVEIALESFAENLEKLRKQVPIRTICMHGSPMSRWDSRLLWKYYDYRDFGITGEPYFDINFDEVHYLTDTGRRWDGETVSVRDRAQSAEHRAKGKENRLPPPERRRRAGITDYRLPSRWLSGTDHRSPFPKLHSTFDIIKSAESGLLPDKIMMTFHPQRWSDKKIPWAKELVWQNVKNQVKYLLVKFRSE